MKTDWRRTPWFFTQQTQKETNKKNDKSPSESQTARLPSAKRKIQMEKNAKQGRVATKGSPKEKPKIYSHKGRSRKIS